MYEFKLPDIFNETRFHGKISQVDNNISVAVSCFLH